MPTPDDAEPLIVLGDPIMYGCPHCAHLYLAEIAARYCCRDTDPD